MKHAGVAQHASERRHSMAEVEGCNPSPRSTFLEEIEIGADAFVDGRAAAIELLHEIKAEIQQRFDEATNKKAQRIVAYCGLEIVRIRNQLSRHQRRSA